MEYSFTNSDGKLIKILLKDFDFLLYTDEVKEVINYVNINTLRISRSAGNEYKMFIYSDHRAPIVISNHSLSENGAMEDRSSGYALLVRVLHHHLKDKSAANFRAGCNVEKILWLTLTSAVLSIIISLTADYFGVGLMNPYMQAAILSLLAIMSIFVFSVRGLPKSYQPTNIPLQFLP